MPAFGKLKIVAAAGLFAAAWIFFSTPGRRVLETLGVYTECAIDVWSLRKHCGQQRRDPAEQDLPRPEPAAPHFADQQAPTAAATPDAQAALPADAGREPGALALQGNTVAPSAQPPQQRALAPPAAARAAEVDRCAALWTTETHMAKSDWRSACQRLHSNAAVPAAR